MPSPSWLRKEMSLGNLILILTTICGLGAAIWQGGAIRATMADGLDAEVRLRQSENLRTNDNIASLRAQVGEVHADMRELRAIILKGQAGK